MNATAARCALSSRAALGQNPRMTSPIRLLLLLALAAPLAACSPDEEAGDPLPGYGGGGGVGGAGGVPDEWTLQNPAPHEGIFAQDCDAQPRPGGTLQNVTLAFDSGRPVLRWDGDVKGYQVLVEDELTGEQLWNLLVWTREGWEQQTYDLNHVIGSPLVYGEPVFEGEVSVDETVPAKPLVDGRRYLLTIVRGCVHLGPVRDDGTRWALGTSAYDWEGSFLYVVPPGQ